MCNLVTVVSVCTLKLLSNEISWIHCLFLNSESLGYKSLPSVFLIVTEIDVLLKNKTVYKRLNLFDDISVYTNV